MDRGWEGPTGIQGNSTLLRSGRQQCTALERGGTDPVKGGWQEPERVGTNLQADHHCKVSVKEPEQHDNPSLCTNK